MHEAIADETEKQNDKTIMYLIEDQKLENKAGASDTHCKSQPVVRDVLVCHKRCIRK